MENIFHRLRHFAYLVTSWWHCFGGGLGSTALGEEVQGRLWECRPSPYFWFFPPSPPHSALLSLLPPLPSSMPVVEDVISQLSAAVPLCHGGFLSLWNRKPE